MKEPVKTLMSMKDRLLTEKADIERQLKALDKAIDMINKSNRAIYETVDLSTIPDYNPGGGGIRL